MDVTPEIMKKNVTLGELEEKKRGGSTSKYQEGRDPSVLSKLDVCIEPVTDHYRSLWVEAVSVKNVRTNFKNQISGK